MKIRAGKKYEGGSNNNIVPDGTYDFLILDVVSDADKGRVKMTLAIPSGRYVFKDFYIKKKDGERNPIGMSELSDFITTALCLEDEDCEVEVEDSVGYFFTGTIKNSTYKNDSGEIKPKMYLNNPRRCEGFDGAQAIMDKYNKNKKSRRSRNAGKNGEEEAPAEEVAAESVNTEGTDTLDFLDDI